MTKNKSSNNIKTDVGGTIREAGSSMKYKTGSWRTLRPQRDAKKCIHCLACFNYCPEGIWNIKNGKIDEENPINFEFCKGCGICASVCPVKCIHMTPEYLCKIGSDGKKKSDHSHRKSVKTKK